MSDDTTKLEDDRTLVLIKPDAMAAGTAEQIVQDICARCGVQVNASGVRTPTADLVRKHYLEHIDKPFYARLLAFMTSGPVMYVDFRGQNNVTAAVRSILPDLRTKYGSESPRNAVHASDSPEAARREFTLWVPVGVLPSAAAGSASE